MGRQLVDVVLIPGREEEQDPDHDERHDRVHDLDRQVVAHLTGRPVRALAVEDHRPQDQPPDQEPHRESRDPVTLPCWVTGTGMPSRVNVVDLQPAVAASTAASMTARGAHRRSRRACRRSGTAAVSSPGISPGTCAPPWRGALGVGLTDCLPSG